MKKRKSEEIKFCEKTLKPLLESMRPYIQNLRYRHGNMEFGKDFTFSYVNPLNQRINVGLQAKWADIKGSSTSLVTDIVNQIQVAFKVPYRNKPDGQELYLNELYIVCSGKYRENAIEIIEKSLRKEFNVHFLDGSDIKDLRNKVMLRKTTEKVEIKRTLNALLIELDDNIKISEEMDRRMEKYIIEKKHFLNNFRLNCLEKALESDIDNKLILDKISTLWHILTSQNNLLDLLRVVPARDEWYKKTKERLWASLKRGIRKMEELRESIASYLSSLE